MVDIKTAVTIAQRHIQDVFEGAHQLQLEEVEQTSGGTGWLVTISFVRPNPETFLHQREYKQIEIDSLGKPVAARIRQV